jgi:carboxylesterase type B
VQPADPQAAGRDARCVSSSPTTDQGFATGALRLSRWASEYAPIATHSSELQYLFDLPNTPVPATLNPAQERLAAGMREAWADFAAGKAPWPKFGSRERVMSFGTTQSQIETNFATKHHADLWL